MEYVLIPQNVYDRLLTRLLQNHLGHKKLSDFALVKQMVEKYTNTTLDGPYVRSDILEIAEDALQKNIKLAGERYQTAPDRLLLLSIMEARAATASASTPEAVQTLQQTAPTKLEPSNPPTPEPADTSPGKPYIGSDSRIARLLNAEPVIAPAPYAPTFCVADEAAKVMGEPPAGHEWWSDGSDGYELMPVLPELPDID